MLLLLLLLGSRVNVESLLGLGLGVHRVEDSSKKSGFKLLGDVNFEEVAPKCEAISPVPGGVGPMTIAGLMMNTLDAVKRKY